MVIMHIICSYTYAVMLYVCCQYIYSTKETVIFTFLLHIHILSLKMSMDFLIKYNEDKSVCHHYLENFFSRFSPGFICGFIKDILIT